MGKLYAGLEISGNNFDEKVSLKHQPVMRICIDLKKITEPESASERHAMKDL